MWLTLNFHFDSHTTATAASKHVNLVFACSYSTSNMYETFEENFVLILPKTVYSKSVTDIVLFKGTHVI